VRCIKGDGSAADAVALLGTQLSVVRRVLAGDQAPRHVLPGDQVPLAHTVLTSAAVLSGHWGLHFAERVMDAGICMVDITVGTYLSDLLATSLLYCTGLVSIQSLCRPLVELHCLPLADFRSLSESENDGLPSWTAVFHMHKAHSALFAELG
jgi:hypothetical protein